MKIRAKLTKYWILPQKKYWFLSFVLIKPWILSTSARAYMYTRIHYCPGDLLALCDFLVCILCGLQSFNEFLWSGRNGSRLNRNWRRLWRWNRAFPSIVHLWISRFYNLDRILSLAIQLRISRQRCNMLKFILSAQASSENIIKTTEIWLHHVI